MYIIGIDIGKNYHEASNSIRSLFIRQTKNDSKDSFLIAEVIRFGHFTTTSLADENLLAMRQL